MLACVVDMNYLCPRCASKPCSCCAVWWPGWCPTPPAQFGMCAYHPGSIEHSADHVHSVHRHAYHAYHHQNAHLRDTDGMRATLRDEAKETKAFLSRRAVQAVVQNASVAPASVATNRQHMKGHCYRSSAHNSVHALEGKSKGRKRRGGKERKETEVQREDNGQSLQDDVSSLAATGDLRTTLMLRNIPIALKASEIIARVEGALHRQGIHDFFYLPMDKKNKCNVGYAFINIKEVSNVPRFYSAMQGLEWCGASEKCCALSYGRIQGLEKLQEARESSTYWRQRGAAS